MRVLCNVVWRQVHSDHEWGMSDRWKKGEVSDRVWQGINNKTTAIADFDTSTYWGIKGDNYLCYISCEMFFNK